MKTKVYFFQYNLPVENSKNGETDCFIDCAAEWNGSFYHSTKRPVVINEGPIFSRLTNYHLMVVKDWNKVLRDVERIAQEYFSDLVKPKNVVELAEQSVKVTIHEQVNY